MFKLSIPPIITYLEMNVKRVLDRYLRAKESLTHPLSKMEWLIPIQTFQVDKIQLGTIMDTIKPMVPLAYRDGENMFPSLSLIFPLLTIKSFDAISGRLVLSLSDHPTILTKMTNFQELLVSTVSVNKQNWFAQRGAVKIVDTRAGFQSMIRGTELHLYCPVNSEIQQTVPFYSNRVWSKQGIMKEKLEPGTRVRIAIRIQGISFHVHPASQSWSGKYRIQHKILGILL